MRTMWDAWDWTQFGHVQGPYMLCYCFSLMPTRLWFCFQTMSLQVWVPLLAQCSGDKPGGWCKLGSSPLSSLPDLEFKFLKSSWYRLVLPLERHLGFNCSKVEAGVKWGCDERKAPPLGASGAVYHESVARCALRASSFSYDLKVKYN